MRKTYFNDKSIKSPLPFQCSECGKSFRLKGELEEHKEFTCMWEHNKEVNKHGDIIGNMR